MFLIGIPALAWCGMGTAWFIQSSKHKRSYAQRIATVAELDTVDISVLAAGSTEWLGTIQTYLADGHDIGISVKAANIAYPLGDEIT
jgi:hypothetical protein